MIKLSNGHQFEFLGSSGLYGFNGNGYKWKFWERPLQWSGAIDKSLLTMVVKTITLPSTKGNYRWHAPWRVIKLLSAEGKVVPLSLGLLRPNLIKGVVNAIGLAGSGFWGWKEKYYPVIERLELKVIASIIGRGDECVFMVGEINQLKNVIAIEFNASCPNIHSGLLGDSDQEVAQVVAIVRSIAGVSKHPVVLKLGYAQDYVSIAKKTEGLVEAISFNSIPWYWVFAGESPLAKYGGGAVSGPICRKFYKRMLNDLVKGGVQTPVIMPVWDYEDIEENFELGASAVSFGSVGLAYPKRPTQFIRRWRQERR